MSLLSSVENSEDTAVFTAVNEFIGDQHAGLVVYPVV